MHNKIEYNVSHILVGFNIMYYSCDQFILVIKDSSLVLPTCDDMEINIYKCEDRGFIQENIHFSQDQMIFYITRMS